MSAEPKRVELTEDLRERLAKEAFVSDDFGGHHQANGSPFAYSPYTWESIPEDGRANYRRLIGDLWPVIVEHFAAREAAARREALLEAERWKREASLAHVERSQEERAHDQTKHSLQRLTARNADNQIRRDEARDEVARLEAKVARVEALAEAWESQSPLYGWLEGSRHVDVRQLRAALAEPERDEEGGND